MRGMWLTLLIVTIAILAPIAGFAVLGEQLEPAVESWLARPHSPWQVALGVAGLLMFDLLLPIPSSFVSTFAGAQLGMLGATIASWLGMTLGATIGFAVARWCGPPTIEWLAAEGDLEHVAELCQRYGPLALVICRPLPILAEASVLALGMLGLGWRAFWLATATSNLGIAVVYSAFGAWSRAEGSLVWALAASVAVPILASALARAILARRMTRPN